jgi:hypothetical protein
MIIKRERLVTLAQKKGFDVNVDIEDEEDFSLWLFMLKEWLIDEHKIFVLPQFYLTAGFGGKPETFGCSVYGKKKGGKWRSVVVEKARNSETLDIAMMAGLGTGLELLG